MKIIQIYEQHCYQWYTITTAIQKLCEVHDIPLKQYSNDTLAAGRILHDTSDDIIFICDAAFLRFDNGLKTVKSKLPNAFIIVLGSDTIDSLVQGKDEIQDVELCDLFLDTTETVANAYNARGIKSDLWMWTFSETVASYCLASTYAPTKLLDVVALMKITNEYRLRLTLDLSAKHSVYVSNGGFSGGISNYNKFSLIDDIYRLYSQSRFVLGTTSPAYTSVRTLKGFRDFLAPFFGSVLIYDDHPEIKKRYFPNNEVPLYKYDNPVDSIGTILEYYSNADRYDEALRSQQYNFWQMSLEKQFENLFTKYDLWWRK